MIKTHFLPILVILSLASCGPKGTTDSSTTAANSTAQVTDTMMTDKAHTSRNALDWNGMYKGVVPCADCEGIETILILNADNTYLLKTSYLGKPDPATSEKTGSLIWSAEGNKITLGRIENAPSQYIVGENKLIQLDMAGNTIKGALADKYVLNKL